MQEENNKLMSASDCPSAEVMQKYISDTLSAKEKNALERHAIDCEICSDALAGYDYSSGKLDLVRENKLIRKRVEVFFTDKKPKKENLAVWAAAASVVIILGASILYFFSTQKKSSEMAMAVQNSTVINSKNDSGTSENFSGTDYKTKIPAPEIRNNDATPLTSVSEPGEAIALYADKPQQEIKKSEEVKDEEVMPPASIASDQASKSYAATAAPEAEAESTVRAKETQKDILSAMFEIAEIKLIAVESLAPSDPESKGDIRNYARAKKSKVTSALSDSLVSSKMVSDKVLSDFSHGVEQYNQKAYRHADEIFTGLSSQNKADMQISIYTILTKIHLGKDKDASKLIAQLPSKNTDAIAWKEWLQAMVNINSAPQVSKALFQKLQSGNNKFKDDAKALLKQLD